MPNQQPGLDLVFRALGDPTRLAIVGRLARGPAPVSELAAPLRMSLPSAMQHIAILEQAGLVTSRKVGRVRTCSIDLAAMSEAERWIGERRREWEGRLDRLGEYLKTIDGGERDGADD
ncbi:MAG: transcriptional regulator, ArsR family [Hyphomicrobiales bacterium]|nr:transcriptional regulator, ArsR family [Hyphomicrobiales bacterium]